MNSPPTNQSDSEPNNQLNQRRALSHIGGPSVLAGDEAVSALLGEALAVPMDSDNARDHVHGFHSYPGKLHPILARGLIERFTRPGERILDPFCGSGTVLVESRLLGRPSIGVDANPLAVRLAEMKAAGRAEEHLDRLLEVATQIAEQTDERRFRKTRISKRYPEEIASWYDPHVLMELDGLYLGISWVVDPYEREDLWLVFSSLLTKVSRKSGDSSMGSRPKRIAAGFPARLFVNKTKELRERWLAYQQQLPDEPPTIRVLEGDARFLEGVGKDQIDFIVSSPPYPGNFDYYYHHELRLKWLGLEEQEFDESELGARRHLEHAPWSQAIRQWKQDFRDVLSRLRWVSTPKARMALILGDSVVQRRAVYNDDVVAEIAEDCGWEWVAQASQERPHFHGGSQQAFHERPRREHVLFLRATSSFAFDLG
jgi:hypothetical protein